MSRPSPETVRPLQPGTSRRDRARAVPETALVGIFSVRFVDAPMDLECEDEAAEIAERGRQLADALTFDHMIDKAAEAIRWHIEAPK